MKTTILVAAIAIITSGPVFAASTATSNAQANTTASSANLGNNQSTTFNSSQPLEHSSVSTTPSVYVAPSAFGWSPSNCGGADTAAISVTGFGFGGSHAKPMFDCNVRQDATMAWKMGLHTVAVMRMFCFGSDLNRQAYEASGHQCPASGTAKGIEGAPTLPKILVVAPQIKRGHINADGTITWQR